MGTRNEKLEVGSQVVLAAVVVAACIAGIPPLVDTVARAVAQSKADALRVGLGCRACGIVESVRAVTLDATKQGISTVSGEGFAMLFGLLTGKLDAHSVEIYEVEVHLQDGSVRVIREGTLPAWKPGDRVKVVMGRVKSVS